jgi:putative SOS response-associated peptidase YedK
MPVVFASEHCRTWLDPTMPAEQLHGLLRPYPAEAMEAVLVGSFASNPRNKGPGCLTS